MEATAEIGDVSRHNLTIFVNGTKVSIHLPHDYFVVNFILVMSSSFHETNNFICSCSVRDFGCIMNLMLLKLTSIQIVCFVNQRVSLRRNLCGRNWVVLYQQQYCYAVLIKVLPRGRGTTELPPNYGSTAVAMRLPPKYNGSAAGKHASVLISVEQ